MLVSCGCPFKCRRVGLIAVVRQTSWPDLAVAKPLYTHRGEPPGLEVPSRCPRPYLLIIESSPDTYKPKPERRSSYIHRSGSSFLTKTKTVSLACTVDGI